MRGGFIVIDANFERHWDLEQHHLSVEIRAIGVEGGGSHV